MQNSIALRLRFVIFAIQSDDDGVEEGRSKTGQAIVYNLHQKRFLHSYYYIINRCESGSFWYSSWLAYPHNLRRKPCSIKYFVDIKAGLPLVPMDLRMAGHTSKCIPPSLSPRTTVSLISGPIHQNTNAPILCHS